MDERSRWEQRYGHAAEPFYGREPSQFLTRVLPLLPAGGRCLDLAGGQGRNAIYLAVRGWDVFLADVAVAGVARARSLARQSAVAPHLLVTDLTRGALAAHRVPWDLILAINYHDRAVVSEASDLLSDGGALVVEGFAREQLGRPSGGPQDEAQLWAPNELLDLAGELRVCWYEDRLVADDDNARHRGPKWVVRLVARKLTR